MAEARGAEALVSEVERLMDKGDVEKLKGLQLQILSLLENSHAVLAHFNDSSAQSYAEVARNFSVNTKILKEMRFDLDYIFRKIRVLRARIIKYFPHAFDESVLQSLRDQRPNLEEAPPSTEAANRHIT
ncbi:hypothetical protein KFL_003050120 [Klebsormidium nitens]|uniref:KxDL domain-containing protein n=1 Tax=Klebsormidium nitens TaxID=105231 RepID=A0A1Y1I6X9_KLENI|nr:hypothetical protein KFL_003050120 [Klebsormidium nitens]|eukprot:GAQ86700.1 hypothetical protein KFL_003050120 [Klebsormidium nitens]